uniref:Mki67ipl_0 protein n=1 Tax=Fopius arisanus TaxID=64838 RepID=A0A0C9PTB0_9HYME
MSRPAKKVEDFYHHYTRSNDWAVHFTNIKELPPEQVKQFFSKWGAIKNVRQTGSTGTGYCFVHFELEESARNCALALKNELSVRLRPFMDRPLHVPRRKEKEEGLNGEELDFSFKKREPKYESRILKPDPAIDASNHRRLNEINGESSEAVHRRIPEFSTTKISEAPQERPLQVWELTKTADSSSRIVENSKSDVVNSLGGPEDKVLKYSGAASIVREEFLERKIPELQEVSEVSSSIVLSELNDHVKIATAEEVIVANIPAFCGIDIILELFRDFEPLCVTNIKLIPKNLIRYCHIYFQTPLDAKTVENIYDNAEIFGEKLIVLRVEALVEEALGG